MSFAPKKHIHAKSHGAYIHMHVYMHAYPKCIQTWKCMCRSLAGTPRPVAPTIQGGGKRTDAGFALPPSGRSLPMPMGSRVLNTYQQVDSNDAHVSLSGTHHVPSSPHREGDTRAGSSSPAVPAVASLGGARPSMQDVFIAM